VKHNNIVNGVVADISEPVKVQQVNGKNVARTQICFVEENKQQNAQHQFYRTKFLCEAWGEAAQRLQTLPVGHTVMMTGKFQNYNYEGQNSEKKYGTKFVAMKVADCGPSEYPPEQKQQGQGYQQGPQGYPQNQYAGQQPYPPQGQGPYGQQNQGPYGQQGNGARGGMHTGPGPGPQQHPSTGQTWNGQNAQPNASHFNPGGGVPNGQYPPPPTFDHNEQIPF